MRQLLLKLSVLVSLLLVIGLMAGTFLTLGTKMDNPFVAVRESRGSATSAARTLDSSIDLGVGGGDGEYISGFDTGFVGRPIGRVAYSRGGRINPADADKPATPRKLVYNADVHVIVKDLDEAKTKVQQAMKDHLALLTNEDLSGTSGEQRYGKWTIRVPTDKFEVFVAALGQLGNVERTTTRSQDVTEEFYDLKGRIAQKEIEAKGLDKLQEEAVAIMNKDPKARMEDVLAVRREWNNVRQELDRMQGRLKLLDNLTELTTVTLTVREIKNYVPPSAPTLANRIGNTWSNSTDSLQKFGEGVVLLGVGLAPWLPLILVVLVPLAVLVRRAIRRTSGPSTPATAVTAVPNG